MERLSDRAIEIVNELCIEKLDYYSEYIPLINALNRLAAYEDGRSDSDNTRDEYIQGWHSALDAIAYGQQTGVVLVENPLLQEYINLGTLDHLRELVQAEQDQRLVTLSPYGNMIYTIERNYLDCDNCRYKDQAYFSTEFGRVCCNNPYKRCPLYVKEHQVEEYKINVDENGDPILSGLAKSLYEGFKGLDGKYYLSLNDALAALEARMEDKEYGSKN